jgi:hypothetical protein
VTNYFKVTGLEMMKKRIPSKSSSDNLVKEVEDLQLEFIRKLNDTHTTKEVGTQQHHTGANIWRK